METALTHLSLFAGIGGTDLAASWAGIRTIAYSEVDPYCIKVLERHFPDIPNLGDVRRINQEVLYGATGERSVDVLSGGFPCQPFSTAGKRRGTADDRYLWPAMLAAIEDIRPRWVVAENVAGFVSLALDATLSDLEGCGYSTGTVVLPACSVGAWHRRERVFAIAHIDGIGGMDISDENDGGTAGALPCPEPDTGDPLGDAPQAPGCASCESTCGCRDCPVLRGGSCWSSEPAVARMAHGVPDRVDRDRIRVLGNAVCPQQVYPVFETIAKLSG